MFEDEETTYKSAIAFYITSRLFVGLWYLLVAILVPMIRGTALMHVMIITTSATLWIGSMHAEWPGQQLPLIWVAIPIDLFGSMSYHISSTFARSDRFRHLASRTIAEDALRQRPISKMARQGKSPIPPAIPILTALPVLRILALHQHRAPRRTQRRLHRPRLRLQRAHHPVSIPRVYRPQRLLRKGHSRPHPSLRLPVAIL